MGDLLLALEGMSPGAKLIVLLILAVGVMCQRYLSALSRRVDELRVSDEILARIITVLETMVDRD